MSKEADETTPLVSGIIKTPEEIPQHVEINDMFCCGIFWHVKGDFITRANFTQFSIYPFPLVMAFSFFTLYVLIVSVAPLLPPRLQFMKYIAVFFNLLMFTNFEICRFRNPGVIPWDWSLTKKKSFTKKELREGIIMTDEQYDFCKKHDRPPRSWISSNYGYIILRGDHFCKWIGNWVGIRNHKFFMNGVLCASIYISIAFWFIIYTFFTGTSMLTTAGFAALVPFGCFLFYLAFGQTYTQFFQLAFNTTTVERLKGKIMVYFDDNYLQGFEEIYGPVKYFWTWLLPIPPKNTDGFSFEPRTSSKYSEISIDGDVKENITPKQDGRSFFKRTQQIGDGLFGMSVIDPIHTPSHENEV